MRPSPSPSQIQPQQLLHKTDVTAIMGTVKLIMTCERQCEANWGVHLAFYFGQPRIVQHSPSLEAGGVTLSGGSDDYDSQSVTPQNPCSVRLCDTCDTCDALFGGLSALPGPVTLLFFGFLFPQKLQTTRHSRHKCHKPLQHKAFGSDASFSYPSLPSAKRHSLIPVPPTCWSLTWRA